MNGLRKAACAVALIATTSMWIGCGATFRQVATVLPTTTGNPAGAETEVVLNQCLPTASACKNSDTGIASASVLTAIDVSGDTNSANRQLQNQVGGVLLPLPGGVNIPVSPMAFDFGRISVFTANTATDSVSQLQLSALGGGFAASTTTIGLSPGSAPVGISFQYFGSTYTQDYVVNSGTTTSNCPGTGSLAVIQQTTSKVVSTVCIGKYSGATLTAAANPVLAWIYQDQSKVFVLDNQAGVNGNVYVVSASKYEVTNSFPVGVNPVKAAQSNNGQYIYVLNSGSSSISVIDGKAEQVVSTVLTSLSGTASPPIDIAQDTNFNDASTNTQINHVWILHADGTVSVWDGTVPGQLTWITSIPTITTAQTSLTPPAYPTNLALLRDGTYAYVGIGNTDQIVAIDTSKLVVGAPTPGVNSTASQFPATAAITVGVQRGTLQSPLMASLSYTYTDTTTGTVLGPFATAKPTPVEITTPVVTNVAVSRQGNSADQSKAYATTTTTTTYFCYDYQTNPVDCNDPNGDPWTFGNPVVASGTTPTPPASPAFLVAGCTDLGAVQAPVNPNSTNNAQPLYAMSCPNLYNGTSIVTAAAIGTTPVNTYLTTLPAPMQLTYCTPGNPATGEYDGQKNCPAMTPTMVLGRN